MKPTKTLAARKDIQQTFQENLFTLRTLTSMQLREKTDFSYLSSFRKTLFKTVWLAVEIAAITAICWLVLYFVRLLGIFSLINDIPTSVVAIVFTFITALSVLFGTASIMKSLYFSRDNNVLLTFPAKPAMIFLSKLCVYYVHEFRKNFMFLIPFFVGYGIVKMLPWTFYPWLLFLFALISAATVLLSAFLSIIAMFFYQILRKVKLLQYLLYLALGVGAVFLVLYLISLIPENIDLLATWGTTFWEIQAFLADFTSAVPFMHKLTELVVGRRVGIATALFHDGTLVGLLVLIAVVALLGLLNFLLARPLFYRMASKPFEHKKVAAPKKRQNFAVPSLLSALRKELRIGIRSNSLLTLAGILVVVMPLAIELLNTLYAAMDTRALGTQMTVSFTALILLLILLSSNISIASAFSRDGTCAYLNKVQPRGYAGLLTSKLVYNALIALLGTGVSLYMYMQHSSMDLTTLLLFGGTVYLTYIAHLFWSAEMDIMNPQYAQYATFSDNTNNPNENKSTLLTFLLSFLVFALSLLLSLETTDGLWMKLMVVAGVLAVAKIVTFYMKVGVFYQEK